MWYRPSKRTKSAIDALPVPAKDTVYWDAGLPGFGVKVMLKGKKVFIVLYRTGGAGSRLRKYTVGPYGRITLAMARAQAQKIFAARLDGRDPAAEKANSRRRLVVDRVDGLVETFILERLSDLRSGPRVVSRLRNDVIPRWGTKSIHEIKRHDIVDLVSEVAQRGPGAMYGRCPRCKRKSDFLRSVRVQPCIRPIFAWRITSVAMQPLWLLALM